MNHNQRTTGIVQFILETQSNYNTTIGEMAEELLAILEDETRLEAYARAFYRRDYHDEGPGQAEAAVIAHELGADSNFILNEHFDTDEDRRDFLETYAGHYSTDEANEMAEDAGLAHLITNDESEDE